MKDLGKNLGRTLAVALLVGAGSVISAVSALPDYLQAAETASAADKRQEHIQEVAGSDPVTVRQHEVVLKDHQGRELYTGKYLELVAKNGAGHDVRRALARWNDAERTRCRALYRGEWPPDVCALLHGPCHRGLGSRRRGSASLLHAHGVLYGRRASEARLPELDSGPPDRRAHRH